ncbi:MAG: NifU family protein [bacterium]|jgi:Fe-S cluster biogenesis protein NfuA|nr:NifU family protein [bacterium]
MEMERETILRKVKNVLEQVRPYLQQDGGDVNFVELTDDMVVLVQLTGACGNCPHSKMTLKNGIESVMKKVIPEIKAVEQAETLDL